MKVSRSENDKVVVDSDSKTNEDFVSDGQDINEVTIVNEKNHRQLEIMLHKMIMQPISRIRKALILNWL